MKIIMKLKGKKVIKWYKQYLWAKGLTPVEGIFKVNNKQYEFNYGIPNLSRR